MSADLTVTPAGDEVTAAGTTATIDARTEVHPPRVGQLGTAVENEVALPITPRRGSDDTDPATDDGADGASSFTSGLSDRF